MTGSTIAFKASFEYREDLIVCYKCRAPSLQDEFGKNIQSCKSVQIVNFTAVNVELPEVDSQSLSSDQQYLLDICNAVARGHCLPSLALMNPGKLCHERWLTTANRILQLYVASSEPSDNLRLIVEFIMKVYCIMWFTIRSKPSFSEGARHLWQTIRSSRYLNDALKAIVDPVISRNAYYAHPENLLLAMISDDRPHIRTLGLHRIMKARSMTPSENETTIRKFLVPELNFNANDYSEIIDWQKCLLTEPPITVAISDETLEKMILKREVPELNKFPCHTQAVERYVNSGRGIGCCAWC